MYEDKHFRRENRTTKKMALESIMFCIDSAKDKYRSTTDCTVRLYIAQDIERLARAYETVANAKD